MTDPNPTNDANPVFEHLDPRARWGMRLSAMVGGLLLVSAVGLMIGVPMLTMLDWRLLGGGGLGAAIVIMVVAALVTLVLAWVLADVRWRHTHFALTAQGLRIQRGLWWRSDTLIPHSRLQHLDVHRGPLDRRLGLAGIRVYTAGSQLGRISLNGLSQAQAQRLRDSLVQSASHEH